ncbi:MAG: plasma-membrane proton-efflux P-type ATPase, partial [Actinomycetota bacterium]|nr:plasma-membrane proton-efflux P-type ATPase [Actinomycetota bacterium]
MGKRTDDHRTVTLRPQALAGPPPPAAVPVPGSDDAPAEAGEPGGGGATGGVGRLAGLTSAEAAERLGAFGPNAVAEARPNRLLALARGFWGLVPWMLEAAIGIELYLGNWVEAVVIAALLVFNAGLSFFQQNKAQRALDLLRQRLNVTARVRRDGRWQEVPAAGLVPGDVVHLRVGDIVPADVELADGRIEVDQSQLTGESARVDEQPGATAYSGSLLARGEASGVVSATGTRTYFGKTAELVRVAEAPRRLEILIVRIAKYLAAVVVALAAAVFVYWGVEGRSFLDMLPFGLMLLVASVPVALPAMFTMSATLGAQGLAQNGILVTRLSAIEDAATMDVVCLDKTGTVTENRLSVEAFEPKGSRTPDELLRLAALASDEATQDPIDLAVLAAARARGLPDASAREDFVPFEPATKRSEATVRLDGKVLRVVKGAPSIVADLVGASSPGTAADVERLSAGGSRVLAVAAGEASSLELAGLIALADPPRPESAELIRRLHASGMKVLLVTGDGEDTARAVATKVGITGAVAPSGTLHEGVDPETVSGFEVFAGVLPQDKFNLVKALQDAGHVVGMTGDGVNDAPALRQADVGIAVADSTDVAKAAASMVLTRAGIGEIMAAVQGSRRIYQRMKTFVVTMLARKIGIPIFLAGGVVLAGVFVTTPALIVLLMFGTDIATMTLSTDQVVPSQGPDRWSVSSLVATGAGIGVLLVAASTAVYWSRYLFGLNLRQTQTLVFAWLVFGAAQAILYLMRNPRWFWHRPYPSRMLAVSSVVDIVGVGIIAWVGWLTAPISIGLIAACLGLAVVFLFAADLLKMALAQLESRS